MTARTEWTGRDYHQVSGMQQTLALECLEGIELRETEHVLDVGCGDGKITAEIAARVPGGSVLGVDRSRDMIAFANEQFGPAAPENPSGDNAFRFRQMEVAFAVDGQTGA